MKNPEQAHQQNGLEQFSEPDAVAHLEKLGVKNVEAAFTVAGENDINGQPIENAEIFWVRYGVPEELKNDPKVLSVEGKVYFPKERANGELILFTPGFPGGNAGRFEQRYVQAFLDAGYAFATVRHNGASFQSGEAKTIMNCPKRMEIAKAAGERHVGGTRTEGYGPTEMINEPICELVALHGRFSWVHLIGQSMGVASSYNALTRIQEYHPEIADKIGNVIGISGYVGTSDVSPDGIWNATKGSFDALTDYELGYMRKVDLNAPEPDEVRGKWYANEMKEVARANERMQVPDHVGNILVFTPADPLIAGPDKAKENYALEYGPKSKRKLIIEDGSKPPEDKKAHSMLWIAPENLVRAVQTKVSEHGPHYVKVGGTRGQGLVSKG